MIDKGPEVLSKSSKVSYRPDAGMPVSSDLELDLAESVVTAAQAINVMSHVDFDITQVVDANVGIHARIPKCALLQPFSPSSA